MGELPIAYVDVVCDLFHYGHVEFFRQVRQRSRKLIVGVHADAEVARYKRQPIMTMDERIRVVEACRYVDAVVPEAPLSVSIAHLDRVGADLIAHGDDIDEKLLEFFYADIRRAGRLLLVPYTAGISTSEIIARVKSR